LDKFRDKDGNWREHIQRVEEDILMIAVRYSVQEEERERGGNLRVEREQECVEGTMA
jgi:hypothetical protein